MKKNVLKNIYSGLMALVLLITAISITVSWIESDISPEISGSMKLSSSPGLIMSFNGNISEVIDINNFVLDPGSTLVLAECSSAVGTYDKLFVRTVSDALVETPASTAISESPSPTSTDDSESVATNDVFARQAAPEDINTKFVYFTFSLKASEADLDVWLDSNTSKLELKSIVSAGRSINVLRFSLTLTDDSGNIVEANNGKQTTIFAFKDASRTQYLEDNPDYQQMALKDFDRTTNLVQPFESLQAEKQSQFYQNQEIHYLEEYDQDHPWLSLEKGQTVRVSLLVWLEGTDMDCKDSSTEGQVSGSELELFLKFMSNISETSGGQ